MNTWKGWTATGREVELHGRTASELFADADRTGCVRLVDWHNATALKLSDGWVWML